METNKWHYTKNSKPVYNKIVLDSLGRECYFDRCWWVWLDENHQPVIPGWKNDKDESDKFTLKHYLVMLDANGEYIRDYKNRLMPFAPKRWKYKDGEQ